MISEKIITQVKKNAEMLTDRLMKDLLSREETKGYRNLNIDSLYDRVFDVCSRLDSWLVGNKVKGEIRHHYLAMGRKRFHEGIPLCEVVMALMLIKRHLWLYVQEQQFFDSTYECYQALEFNNRVVLFFDRAIYFTTMGYVDEMSKATQKQQGGIFLRLLRKKQELPYIEPHLDLEDLPSSKIV